MSRVVRLLGFFVFTLLSVSLLTSLPPDAEAQAGKKAKKKTEDKKDEPKKEEPKEPEKKKEPFVPDTPQVELKGHADWINALAYSNDGKILVSSSRDRTMRVWNVESKKETHILKGSSESIRGLTILGGKAFSTNGKWNKEKKVWEGEIKIWDIAGGKETGSIKGHAETIESVTASKDGKFLATSSEDQTAKIWDASGKELQTLKGHAKAVHSIALTADGAVKSTMTSGCAGSASSSVLAISIPVPTMPQSKSTE